MIFNQSNLVAKILARAKTVVGAHKTTHAVGGSDAIFPADPGADRFLKFNNTSNALEWAEAGGSFAGTMDNITDGSTYVKTHNDFTDDLETKLNGIDLSDVLRDGDIGVTVQGYDENLMRFFVSNEVTDANKSITGDNQLVLINTDRDAVVEVDFTIGTVGCLLAIKVVSINTGWECGLTGCGFSETLYPADLGLTRIFVSDGVNYIEIARYVSGVSIPVVDDTAYDESSWNDNLDAPTKNAVRDKFEGLTIAEAKLSIADNTTANLTTTAHGFAPKAPNNTTTFLRGDATWAAPVNNPTTVKLTGDLASITVTTVTDSTGLVFALVAGTYYHYRFNVLYTSAATTTGLKVALTYPAVTIATASVTALNSGAASVVIGRITASGGIVTGAGTPSTTAPYMLEIAGTILPSSNGNLQVQHGSEIATSGVTIKQASNGLLFTL